MQLLRFSRWLPVLVVVGCHAAPAVPTGMTHAPVFGTNNQVSLHPDGEALPALLSMLRGAETSIFIETFQFFDSGPGPRAIIDVLKAKHAQGLDVRVIVDSVGMKSAGGHAVAELRAAGIPTVVYGPFPFRGAAGEGVNFTHRKLYLVDFKQGMTGGMNLGDNSLSRFHDMLWTVNGDAAWELHRAFSDEWTRAGGKDGVVFPAAQPVTEGDEPVAVLVTSPRERGHSREILASLLQGIRLAEHRVDMAYPFFWDNRVAAALSDAVKRGVQVHVILTGHDRPGAHQLNQAAAQKLAAQGVSFRRYGPVFAHIKYCVVDGNFLLAGSSNADGLTFDNNQELDLLLTRPATVAMFRARVSDPDWAASTPLAARDLELPSSQRMATRLLQQVQQRL